MSSFLLNLPHRDLQALRRLSKSTGATVSDLLRQGYGCLLSGNLQCGISIGSGAIASGTILIVRVGG